MAVGEIELATGRRIYELHTYAQVAGTDQTNAVDSWVSIGKFVHGIAFWIQKGATTVAGAGDALGVSVDCRLDSAYDNNSTYIPVATFTASAGAQAVFTESINIYPGGGSATVNLTGSSQADSGDTLTAGGRIVIGTQYRCRYTVVDNAGNDVDYSFGVWAIPY